MNKSKELAKNTLIIAVGKVSTQLISFLMLPLYTAYLSPKDYGTVDLIVTYVALLAPAVTIQMEMAAFRFLIDVRGDAKQTAKVITNVLQITLTVLALFGVGYGVLCNFVHIPFALLILLNVIAMVIVGLFLQFARGFGKNIHYAIASIVIGVTTIASNLVLIIGYHQGARGMLTSVILASALGSIYLFWALRLHRYIRPALKDRALKKTLMHYSLPLVPNGISWWVISVSDRTIISILISVAANGIYAVSNKFAAIFTAIFSIFGMSWTESASVHIDDADRDVFFSQTGNASVKFFGGLGASIIAALPLVFPLLVSSRYKEAYLYIPILIIAAFFNAVVGLYSAIYVAKKMTRQVASTSIASAAINIVLNLALIKFIGIYAAALSTVAAYLAMAIYRHYDLKKYVRITYETSLFPILAVLYAVTTGLYYYNHLLTNIVNLLITGVAVLVLNKSVIKVINDKILHTSLRNRKKSIEEEVFEEII